MPIFLFIHNNHLKIFCNALSLVIVILLKEMQNNRCDHLLPYDEIVRLLRSERGNFQTNQVQ